MNPTEKQTRFPFIATIVAFSAIVIMLALGFWQLDRKSQKQTRLDNIEEASGASAFQLSEIVTKSDQYLDYQIKAQGTLLEPTFFIDNVIRDGRAGFYIMKPMSTNYGIVTLNYGWIPATGPRGKLPELTFEKTNEVTGILYLPTDNVLVSETNRRYGQFPALLQQVDLDEISMHLDKDVLPFTIRLNQQDEIYTREWQIVSMSPEKHLGYAIQWFGLAIAALTIYLLSVLKHLKAPKVINNEHD